MRRLNIEKGFPKFPITPHIIPYALPKVVPFLTYIEPRGKHSIIQLETYILGAFRVSVF
jgi:hypothetical protein